ncbi:hypothetical protein [Hymenobacter convexus]|uniref:hypothetical protein n=1 Tax=Hymenobacter sp. CA1UV-4 TaxID=3063782 RepID=UPI002712E29E|nr:hypothetical protein [Hymenobacter sp. CA1UV-4]MDO7850768.1 hypothetical protein [Hymenobacter sp. CA1UV-4]
MRTSFLSTGSFRRHPHAWGYVVVALVTFGLMTLKMSGPLFHPDTYLLANGGDGVQSYFATAFYGLYDQGVRFTGMNYPYGEHVNYPNMQPLIAWVISFLERHGVHAGHRTIGITNFLALLAFGISPLVMYAVLRRFRLPVLYAALTAVLIVFLTPQLLRLGGHTSLSYAFFLPLLWYYIIRMQEEPLEWRWYAWFVGMSLFVAGIMPYFTAAASFFLLSHVIVLSWQRKHPKPLLWRMVVAALLPLLVYRAWLWLTDPATDRPPNPFGLLVYTSSWTGIFVPFYAPAREVWLAIAPTDLPGLEGENYLGLVAGGVLVGGAILGLYRALRSRQWMRLVRPTMPAPLAAGLWAGFLLLMYAFGYPLKWQWFVWFKDHSGPIKQFRALGRFAWPFYYVAGTYAAYYIYRWWRYHRLHGVRGMALPWLPLLLIIWAGEAWVNFYVKGDEISRFPIAKDFMDPDHTIAQQLGWANHQVSDFQAILPLPYFNIGSDKVDLSGTPNSFYNAEHLAVATGLPLLATYVSRPSVEHMIRHVQLLSSPMLPKPLLDDFPSRKPILLMVANGGGLSPAEERIIKLAHPLNVPFTDFTLYELAVADLARTDIAAERAKAATLLPTLPQQPGGWYTTTGRGVLVQGYDKEPDHRSHLGTGGAFYAEPEQFSKLYDGPLPLPADTGRYEVSVWVNIKNQYGNGNLQINLFSADGRQLEHKGADGRVATELDGPWLRVVLPFNRPADATRLEVLYDSRDLLADDLLVRPVDTDVYYYVPTPSGRQLVKNTYLLGK